MEQCLKTLYWKHAFLGALIKQWTNLLSIVYNVYSMTPQKWLKFQQTCILLHQGIKMIAKTKALQNTSTISR